MVTPFSDPPLSLQTDRICPVFQILLQSESPTYLNSDAEKKLQFPQWLISATPLEFSHLQMTVGSGSHPRHSRRLGQATAGKSKPVPWPGRCSDTHPPTARCHLPTSSRSGNARNR